MTAPEIGREEIVAMAWIREAEPEQLATEKQRKQLAELFEETRDPVSGNVDNILKVHALHPEGMAAHWQLYRSAMAGTRTLRKVDREMVALVVSCHNTCNY